MKKRILTGIKPTGEQLHLGNYFGSMKHILEYQNSGEYEMFMFIPNMHSLTAIHDPEKIRQYTMNALKTYLACGIDPKKTLIFNQSMVPGHAQLERVFTCITNM